MVFFPSLWAMEAKKLARVALFGLSVTAEHVITTFSFISFLLLLTYKIIAIRLSREIHYVTVGEVSNRILGSYHRKKYWSKNLTAGP